MVPQVLITSYYERGIISSLRAPCAQNLTIRHGFSRGTQRNLGQTLVLPSTSEPITAPADGTILSIVSKVNTTWKHTAGDLDIHKTKEIKIHHGADVYTVIQGVTSTSLLPGSRVVRGDTLGTSLTTEFFFQLLLGNSPVDPATYTSFFRGFDGVKVTGKGRKLRAGPDFVTRAVSDTVSYLAGGIRYFVDKYCTKPPLLVSIDFNGDGSKSGLGVTGFTANDHWNAYDPVVYDATSGYLCYAVLNPASEIVGDTDEHTTGDVTFASGVLFETLVSASGSDDIASSVSITGGVIFDTIVIEDHSAVPEALAGSSTWLSGSTETVPEIDAVTNSSSFLSGAIAEMSVATSAESWGTNSTAFTGGVLFDASIVRSYENWGTNSTAFTGGVLFDQATPVTFTEEMSASTSFTSGALV